MQLIYSLTKAPTTKPTTPIIINVTWGEKMQIATVGGLKLILLMQREVTILGTSPLLLQSSMLYPPLIQWGLAILMACFCGGGGGRAAKQTRCKKKPLWNFGSHQFLLNEYFQNRLLKNKPIINVRLLLGKMVRKRQYMCIIMKCFYKGTRCLSSINLN